MSEQQPRPCDLDYGEQDENGVDLTLIRHLLSLSPKERLEYMNRASRNAYEVYEIGRRSREERECRSDTTFFGPIPEAHQRELDRRIADEARNPSHGDDWETVKQRLLQDE